MKKRIVKSSVSACLAVIMTCEMGAMDIASVSAATKYLSQPEKGAYAPFQVESVTEELRADKDSQMQGDFTYYEEDGMAYVEKYTGTETKDVVVPGALGELKVGYIGAEAFKDHTEITSVTLPDSIIKIEEGAFAGDIALTDVHLPDRLIELGKEAFAGCTALAQIHIPLSLQTVDAYGYENTDEINGPFKDSGLQTVTFDDGMNIIPQYLFAGAFNLTEITIPETVEEIREGAFAGTGLRKVTVPDFVTVLQEGAFANCASLQDVQFGNSLVEIGAMAFLNDAGLTDVVLPEVLVELHRNVFTGCTALTEITIPATLDKGEAFGYDADAQGPFADSGLTTVHFEEGTTEIAENLFTGVKTLTNVTIPDTVVSIEYGAFANTGLMSVTIPDSVVVIGNGAFANNMALTSVTLGNNVTEMNNAVFQNCAKLSMVQLSEALQIIPMDAFENDKALKTIVIPDSVTELEEAAFKNSGLTEVTIPESVKTVGCSVFEGTPLKKVVMNGTADISYRMFAGCKHLTDITMARGVKNVESEAFEDCILLKSIEFPYGVKSIGDNIFNKCTSLTSVTIPRTVKKIGEDIFSYPTRITITGVSGTYAQEYAKNHNMKFTANDVKVVAAALNQKEWVAVLDKNHVLLENDLKLTATPANFTDEVVWTTSNYDVASVDSDGHVVAKKAGSAVITVTVGDVTASCKVLVEQKITSLSYGYGHVRAGQTIEPSSATIVPSDASNKKLSFTSMDPSIAKVSADGKVTGVSKGTTTIVVKATDGSEIFDNAQVTVDNNRYVITNLSKLESKHNVADNHLDVWEYRLAGADKLQVTFDETTELAENSYLTIFNVSKLGSNRNYRGASLAGQTVFIKGDTVRLQMNNPQKKTGYGFKIKSVQKVSPIAPTISSVKKINYIGSYIAFNTSVTGGDGKYTYLFKKYNKATNKYEPISGESSNGSCSYFLNTNAETGNQQFLVEVKDSFGDTVESKPITVIVRKPVAVRRVFTKKELNRSYSIYANGEGGNGSYEYKFTEVINSKEKTVQNYSKTSAYNIKTATSGTKTYYVYIRDSEGSEVKKMYTTQINVPALRFSKALNYTVSGEKVVFTGEATGGIGTYQYEFSMYNEQTKKWTTVQKYGSSNKYTWKAPSSGKYVVKLYIKDVAGNVIGAKTETINAANLRPIVSLRANTSKPLEGSSVTLVATAKSGSGGYTYRFLAYNTKTKEWTELRGYDSSDRFVWETKEIGVRHIYVDVKDSKGAITRSKPFGVTTSIRPEVGIKLSDAFVASGDKITITAQVKGGFGYTYRFVMYNPETQKWSQLRGYSSNNSYRWTTSGTGMRHICVDVMNQYGVVIRSSVAGVTIGPKLTIKTTASAKINNKGGNVTFTATAAGGYGAYKYRFIMYDNNTKKWTALNTFGPTSKLTWKATTTGNRNIYAEVKDYKGRVVRSGAMNVRTLK